MPAILYLHAADMPDDLRDRLVPDQSQCEIGVTCRQELELASGKRSWNQGVGVVLRGNYDTPTWEPTVVITDPDDADLPVFACEDCAEWLASAIGGIVIYSDDVKD